MTILLTRFVVATRLEAEEFDVNIDCGGGAVFADDEDVGRLEMMTFEEDELLLLLLLLATDIDDIGVRIGMVDCWLCCTTPTTD